MNPYIELPKVPIIRGRHDFLVNMARGKRVLHLGCVDAGLLEVRFQRGELLHQRLDKVAEELWGFDIDEEGIDFLRTHGFPKVIAGDVSFLDQHDVLREIEFDLILASEVVEHLQNPGLFFQSVQKLMKPGHTQLVVTVPNAFRTVTLFWLLRGIEYVHPDHNYWFSYLTISNLIRKNGLTIDQILTYSFQKSNLFPGFLRRRFDRYIAGRQAGTQGSVSTAPEHGQRDTVGEPVSLFKGIVSFVSSLPSRVLTSWLFKRTSFWADGIIVIAKVDITRVA